MTTYSKRQLKDTPQQLAIKLLGCSLQCDYRPSFQAPERSQQLPPREEPNLTGLQPLQGTHHVHRPDLTPTKIQLDRLYREPFLFPLILCTTVIMLKSEHQLHHGSALFHCSQTKLQVTHQQILPEKKKKRWSESLFCLKYLN